jgi:hypothetical protein
VPTPSRHIRTYTADVSSPAERARGGRWRYDRRQSVHEGVSVVPCVGKSGHRDPTVDDDCLAGDKRTRFGGQPHQGRGRLGSIPHAPQEHS